MKKLLLSLLFVFFVKALVIAQNKNEKFVEKSMNRVDLCKENYTKLFGGEALTGKGTDPELMDILQKFILLVALGYFIWWLNGASCIIKNVDVEN